MDPTLEGSEEIREDEVRPEEVDEDVNSRIDALEEGLALQGEQIVSIANEQTKIVEILEQMSDKLNAPSVDDVEVEETEMIEEENNSLDVEESLEASEDEVAAEEVEVDNSAESKDEESEESEEESEDEKSEEEDEEDEEKVKNEAPKTEEEPAEEEAQEDIKKENTMTSEELNALKEQIKNEILDGMVKEPEVKEAAEEEKKEEAAPEIAKNWRERYNKQVEYAWNAYRLHNTASLKKLEEINAYNASLKVKNDVGEGPITIESLDSFVLPPEIDTMIHGKRTRYSDFLGNLEFATTDRLTFAYATRVGDISMRNVALCDDGEDGNLKPIETYGLEQGVAQMEELAAVTPICDNATRYMAVDILSDVASGYRNDYDRKLAQIAIVRIQQAINATGQAIEFDPTDSVDALVQFIKATTNVSDGVVNGKFVFNAKTKAALVEYLFRAAANGQLGHDVMTTGEVPTIFGYPYVVVPNDLMPTLGATGETPIVFQALNNVTGQLESTTITSPVFYGDLDEFRGKVSGALKYDVSADAAYEVLINGQKETRSAWQRNELVLRGSFLRGGYIADPTVFAGLEPKA